MLKKITAAAVNAVAPKTLASTLANATKVITDLEEVAARANAEGRKIDEQIDLLCEKQDVLAQESDRATRVAGKLKELLA